MNLMVFNKKNKELLHIDIQYIVVICYEVNLGFMYVQIAFRRKPSKQENVQYILHLKYILLHCQNVPGQPSKE